MKVTTPQLPFLEWISLPPNAPIGIELIAASKGDVSQESGPLERHNSTGRDRLYGRIALLNYGEPIHVFELYGMKFFNGAGRIRGTLVLLGKC